MRATKSGNVVFRIGLAFVFASMLGATGARAENKLLAEAVDFTGTFIYLGAKPPGLVIGWPTARSVSPTSCKIGSAGT